MDSEKKKLRIQQLQAQSDYHKFEYSQATNYLLGAIAVLVGAYIPVAIAVDRWQTTAITAIFLFLLIGGIYFILEPFFTKNIKSIERLSKEIHVLYQQLLD